MHLETFKVFCDVVETGNWIERSRGRIRLTQAGEALYQAGKQISQKYRQIEEGLQALSQSATGSGAGRHVILNLRSEKTLPGMSQSATGSGAGRHCLQRRPAG